MTSRSAAQARIRALAIPVVLAIASLPPRAGAAPPDAPDHVFRSPPAEPSPAPALPPLPIPRVAAGNGYRAVDPYPAIPDPGRPAQSGAIPRLVGRADGKDVLAFPLAHTRVSARVAGNVARVEVMQRYDNPSDRRLEAIYAFPLPENAAVVDMTFQIGSRVVQSEVRRREEARATYEAARREGRTAALTEQERPNLFTQSVANVPPHESIFVVLRYVHEVPFLDGRYRFVFPTTIGPRYIPGAPAGRAGPGWSPDTDQVPDASRVTPPVVPPGYRSAHDLELLVQLTPGDAFADVSARSHRIVTGLDGAGARLVALDEQDRVPDKDFVLSYRPAGREPEARALVERERGEDFLLLFVQPPAEVQPAMIRPREVVFLVDKSGSMMGRPIETVKALVARALHALGPDDTFQLIAFDGATEPQTAAAQPNDPAAIARAEAWLSRLRGGGGTEMLAGIRAALRTPADPRRLRMVVFCTDGYIGNEAAVIEAVQRERGDARVFGFGIGSSVNRYLIEGVARAGRGVAEVIGPRDPVDEAVARLFLRLDRPVLTDLQLTVEGAQLSDLSPALLPDLFAGQPLVVAARVRGGAPTAAVLRGRLGGAGWSRRLAVTSAPQHAASPLAGTLWARRRIDELQHLAPGAPAKQEVEEVVSLGLRFNLVTPYTSFVAVERELLVDPRLALATVLVPNELPEGVSHEGIFGPARVQVFPARVKPGDPELWIAAAPTARGVKVKLPFEDAWRDATRDGERWVLRFLVPPGQPDGSYAAEIAIAHFDGREERATASIRVDTSAAAVAVLSAPSSVEPGGTIALRLKPALPLGRIPGLLGRPGGLANALKGEMELKEILVRAPWGALARARMEGALGVWTVELPVPADAATGDATLEIVASDAAGNVSRRRVPVAIGAAAPVERLSGIGGIVAGIVLLGAALLAMALLFVKMGGPVPAPPCPPLAPALRRRAPTRVLDRFPQPREPGLKV